MSNGKTHAVDKKEKAIETIFSKIAVIGDISAQNLALSGDVRRKLVGGSESQKEEKDIPEPTTHLELILLRLKRIHAFILETRGNLEEVDAEI